MIPRIAIVGGGVAGWMAAAALASAFRGRGAIQLVELADQQPADLAEGTLPGVRAFHDQLGIDEDELVRTTGATFSLGSAYSEWSGPDGRFFHPFGPFGVSIDTVGFHHAWLRLRQRGEGGDLEAYSLAAVAASLGRFARPSADPGSVLSSFSYGLHLDAARYVDHLRRLASGLGVEGLAPKLASVSIRGGDGFIDALVLEDGQPVTANLFIDCTDQGSLIGQAMAVGWQDWSSWLACDSVVSVATESAGEAPPFTSVLARPAGWLGWTPLQDHADNRFVFCSQAIGDDAATQALLDGIPRPAMSPPRMQRFNSGRRDRFWAKNCVALGSAAAVLDPLASTRLALIQSGLMRLIPLLPGGAIEPADLQEYNRLTIAEHESLRDFLILHYHASGRGDGPPWVGLREIPDSLASRIELFLARARVAPLAVETFQASDWLAVLLGLHVQPRRYHPFADGLDLADLRGRLLALRTVVRQAADSMPSHAAFIARASRAAPAPVS